MSRFFEEKKLEELTQGEWESLCDRCGKCCLEKLIDERDRLFFTSVSCKLLDVKTGLCTNYPERKKYIPECIRLTLKDVKESGWLPKTCAYRLRMEGKPLPPWHPLLTGTYDSVIKAGMSVANHSCKYVERKSDWNHYIVEWEDL